MGLMCSSNSTDRGRYTVRNPARTIAMNASGNPNCSWLVGEAGANAASPSSQVTDYRFSQTLIVYSKLRCMTTSRPSSIVWRTRSCGSLKSSRRVTSHTWSCLFTVAMRSDKCSVVNGTYLRPPASGRALPTLERAATRLAPVRFPARRCHF